MNYPTNLLHAFAVVCSWRILEANILDFLLETNKLTLFLSSCDEPIKV